MADKRKGRKKAAEHLPRGTTLTDMSKENWVLVEPIGAGGFGVIYSAKKSQSSSATYAAKVEPHGNGPLFVERNFFLRNLKPEMIDEWKKKMKLSFLGLPKYIGSGTHDYNKTQYRFLIMERFGDNINSRLKSAGETVNFTLLATFCSQIIDSLMYIHEKGYAHMDIKPENLLLKYNSKNDQVYLIDFGIIDKYTVDPVFKPDKKKQHNGTLLYCSRDSHLGVGTMRGDLEILGYNILVWCGYELPWSNSLKTPQIVQQKKIDLMSNLDTLKNKVPSNVIKFLQYVNELKHNEKPNYQRAKLILSNIKNDVNTPSSTPRKRKSATLDNNSSIIDSDEGELDDKVIPKKVVARGRKKNDENSIGLNDVPKRRGRPPSKKT